MTDLKICTSEYLISDMNGLGVRHNWLPRPVAEQFLESSKDGEIKLSPDPVTMIDGDLTWFNATDGAQRVQVCVHRAPRTIIAQSPSTVVIHDAWSHQIGESPQADFPSVIADMFGGSLQHNRAETGRDKLKFGRFFLDGDDSQAWVDVGVVPPEQSLHFRYLAAVQTPGVWTTPSEFEPRWEAYARWTRLTALATPSIQYAARPTPIPAGIGSVYEIPSWATHVDVVLIGAGGGGHGGDGGFNRAGRGGKRGEWIAETLVRGIHFPEVGPVLLVFDTGVGGQGGAKEANGTAGAATVRRAIPDGKAALTAVGGAGGTSYAGINQSSRGETPPNFTYEGVLYLGGVGGIGGRPGTSGQPPGAGGGGGFGGILSLAYEGGDGSPGAAWVTPRREDT